MNKTSRTDELKRELEFLIYYTTDMEAIESKTQELQEAREAEGDE
jgi:hypothetical protein